VTRPRPPSKRRSAPIQNCRRSTWRWRARYRAAQRLLADQRTWLAEKRSRCTDGACLKTIYLDRQAELHNLQPARRAGEPMPLPARPFLTIIIPPTDQNRDPVESDPSPATALEITGALKDNEGSFSVTAERGAAYALMNFYIEPPCSIGYTLIATNGARFIVRGFLRQPRQRTGLFRAAPRLPAATIEHFPEK